MFESFCPLRGDVCSRECEWMVEGGACVAYHIAMCMEEIANALNAIVDGPTGEGGDDGV